MLGPLTPTALHFVPVALSELALSDCCSDIRLDSIPESA